MKFYYIPELRDYRTQADLKVSELAQLADISPQTLRRVEKGKRCAPSTAHKILTALNNNYYNKSSQGPLEEQTTLKLDPNDPGPR